MAISPELMLAILAMDSYNRSYGEGLNVEAAGASATQIGNATINTLPNSVDLAEWQAAGFFAQSYTLNGQKIISYRGTDNEFHLNSIISDIASSDVWNGYGTALGLTFNDQAHMELR